MLTILAHLVFWPSLIFNFFFWMILLLSGAPVNAKFTMSDFKIIVLALLTLLIPGIYLFGVF